MCTIDLPVYDTTTQSFSETVRAEIVDIAPHLAHVATFAVHRSPFGEYGFRVSNVETGASVNTFCDSRKQAIELARQRLAAETANSLVRLMAVKRREIGRG